MDAESAKAAERWREKEISKQEPEFRAEFQDREQGSSDSNQSGHRSALFRIPTRKVISNSDVSTIKKKIAGMQEILNLKKSAQKES